MGRPALLSISPEGALPDQVEPLRLSRRTVYRIEFPEPVCSDDLAEAMGRALMVARERGIKGRQPSVQYRPDRPGVTKESSVWYLLKCGRRYIDVLAGVLVGEGYLVKVIEIPNPWDKKEPVQPEDRQIATTEASDSTVQSERGSDLE